MDTSEEAKCCSLKCIGEYRWLELVSFWPTIFIQISNYDSFLYNYVES